MRILAVCSLTLLLGCGKQPSPAPSTAAPTTDTNASGASDDAMDAAQLATITTELTQVVRKYAAEKQRAPKSLDELVADGYLARVPQGPGGKRFAIDKNLRVYVAGQ